MCWRQGGSILGLAATVALASAVGAETDLAKIDIDDLSAVRVTSASRKPELAGKTAAAMFVVTEEDIRRSGATTLPGILRMVPGVLVTQYNENDWQVTMRGLNVWPSNKLLVLIDGRTVYSPLTPGVFWAEQEILVEDIERIEIIRGPGATIWGANAVNGIVNVITKRADERQGAMASVTAGTLDRATLSARVGNHLPHDLFSAVWFKYAEREHLQDDHNAGVFSGFSHLLGGMRLDWDPTTPSEAGVQARFHRAEADGVYALSSYSPPYGWFEELPWQMDEYHLVGYYRHKPDEKRELGVQAFYNHKSKESALLAIEHDTCDIDLYYRFPVGERQDIVCGVGYRYIWDDVEYNPEVSLNRFVPPHKGRSYANVFAEDEITVIPGALLVKLGSKAEYNEYTDCEIQPSVRFVCDPWDQQLLWGAVSRAVRIPSRLDVEGRGIVALPPGMMPVPYRAAGLPGYVETRGADVRSEELIAYELGYRWRPFRAMWLDLAAFVNDYEDLRTYRDAGGGLQRVDDPPRFHQLTVADNNIKGYTYGASASATWSVTDAWRMIGAYSYLEADFELCPGGTDLAGVQLAEGGSPRHMANLRSQLDLTPDLRCDVWIRYVDALPAYGIDAYTTFDVRLAWDPMDRLELALVGRNLAEEWHSELTAYEVERSVYAKLTYGF